MKLSIGAVITSVLMTVAGKIITALGIGFVTYKGIDYMQEKFANWISSQLNNFPSDALQIFYMGGGGVLLNWVFGAIAFIATIKTTSHLTTILKKG